ncbi:MAG: hypothetical protein RIB65_15605 [Ilumatobacter fluminis]|uniref:hypothetical protein n=1 Tax=Ilumatobacter fluminis TaxID=467091 RepID=UPI0032EF34A4
MNKNGWGITISCDDCRMQSTSACDDCVVSFLLRDDDEQIEQTPLVLDLDQVRVVRLLGKAGLVPDLRYDVAS